MKIKLLEPIEGYAEEAEYRCVYPGEHYLAMSPDRVLVRDDVDGKTLGSYPVLTKLKKWRRATGDDVGRSCRATVDGWVRDDLILMDISYLAVAKSGRQIPVKDAEVEER